MTGKHGQRHYVETDARSLFEAAYNALRQRARHLRVVLPEENLKLIASGAFGAEECAGSPFGCAPTVRPETVVSNADEFKDLRPIFHVLLERFQAIQFPAGSVPRSSILRIAETTGLLPGFFFPFLSNSLQPVLARK